MKPERLYAIIFDGVYGSLTFSSLLFTLDYSNIFNCVVVEYESKYFYTTHLMLCQVQITTSSHHMPLSFIRASSRQVVA